MKSKEEQEFFDEMWKFWTPKGAEIPPCIRCYQPAVTLHEIEPKSLLRNWREEPFNSIPICQICHKWAEENPVIQRVELGSAVVHRLQEISDWKGSRIIREIRKSS